jgi:hypothetical protein
VLSGLPAGHASYLTGRAFFPSLISGPFHDGLQIAFAFAILACLVAAVASWLRGGIYHYTEAEPGADAPGPGSRPVEVAPGRAEG